MAEEKRNLCAQIPISLHSRVRQEQEASGQTLSEYMTQLITDFFQMKEGNQNMNHDIQAKHRKRSLHWNKHGGTLSHWSTKCAVRTAFQTWRLTSG